MAESSNAIVNAALAWKEKTAANAKFKVGDYVLYEGHGEGYRRGRIVSLGGSIDSAGCVVEWVGGGRDSVPYARLTPCNSAAPDSAVAENKAAEIKGDGKPTDGSYLLARPYYEIFRDGRMIYACRAWEDVKEAIKKGYQYRVVNSAVAANAVVSNAGRKTVKVELETVSFEKGVRSETRYMSIEEVRDLLKRLGKSGDADSFVSRLERQGASDIAINAPDLYAALI